MTNHDIQVKPYLSTMDDAMRVMMYNRLIKTCTEAGGVYALLAEDGTSLWRYATAAVNVINAPFEFSRPTESPEALFANFSEWLDLPQAESAVILEAVERNQPVIDPAKAPPDMVDTATKNG